MRFRCFFYNKGFDCINLGSILREDDVRKLFPDKFKIDEPPSVIYSLGKTKRNKILSYKGTAFSIYTNDNITYGTVHFDEKAMELLKRMKVQWAQSLRCRKVLSKII